MREQVADRDREVVVRVHQARRRRDDAVAVGVGVVAERDVVPVLELDQPAMAYGLEQSMRILPSWSTVMNAKVGSTVGFTTVMSSP